MSHHRSAIEAYYQIIPDTAMGSTICHRYNAYQLSYYIISHDLTSYDTKSFAIKDLASLLIYRFGFVKTINKRHNPPCVVFILSSFFVRLFSVTVLLKGQLRSLFASFTHPSLPGFHFFCTIRSSSTNLRILCVY